MTQTVDTMEKKKIAKRDICVDLQSKPDAKSSTQGFQITAPGPS